MNTWPMPPEWVVNALREGVVIPAHPLALTRNRRLDEKRQRALTRYYHAAGAGGIAVGVHTTQFEIRRPEHGLFKPVLELAARTLMEADSQTGRRTVRIAGICGGTAQAVAEATFAREVGYHAGLLSLGALREATEAELIEHARAVAAEIPLVGFYLQPAVGGRPLGFGFWRRFAQIPNVIAIKVAPFNRYQTLDVLRAVAESGRAGEIALYTGNDDHIILDLAGEFSVQVAGEEIRVHFAGGLLGHWACWTQQAVAQLERCKTWRRTGALPGEGLNLAWQVTDCNSAFFDAAHQFAGCIAGIHEVLRRQGMLENILCLNPDETLSPGQKEEIDRVYQAYPHLNDDNFVRANRDTWMA